MTEVFKEIELIDVTLPEMELTVKIDCRNCTARSDVCHRTCPQMKAFCSEGGRAVTEELLNKCKRARVHKNVNVTFGKFMGLVGELEG